MEYEIQLTNLYSQTFQLTCGPRVEENNYSDLLVENIHNSIVIHSKDQSVPKHGKWNRLSDLVTYLTNKTPMTHSPMLVSAGGFNSSVMVSP